MNKFKNIDIIHFSIICICLFVITSLIFKIFIFYSLPESFQSINFMNLLQSLFYGLRFDFSIASILIAPIYFFSTFKSFFLKEKSVKAIIYIIPFFILSSGLVGDYVYFESTGKHVGYEISQIRADAKELFLNFVFGYKAYVFYYAVVNMLFFCLLFKIRLCLNLNNKFYFTLKNVIFIGFLFFCVRGSLIDTPLTPNMAYRTGSIESAKLALNGAYSAAYSLIKTNHANIVNNAAALDVDEQYIKPLSSRSLGKDFRKLDRKKNVVLILLESWSGQYVHSINPGSDVVTPYFDSLSTKGLTTQAMFAGGVRTHEGMYSILCSQQNPLGAGIPETQLQSFNYKCLPQILKDAGMHVAMFQGSHTKLVGDFALSLGAENSFGKLDIKSGKLEQNFWGYQDPDLYDFIIDKAKKEEKPFFYIVNTTTTHDTVLPSGVKWRFGSNTLEEKRKSVLSYADFSLHKFIDNWTKEIKEPTLFVLVADHTSGGTDQIRQFTIPFVMFATDNSVAHAKQIGISSQRDIAPTIINHLGGFVPWFSGDIIGSGLPHYADFYSNGYLGYAYDKRIQIVNIFDKSNHHCLEWSDNIFSSKEKACDQELLNQGLAFTKYSQALLFSGKTFLFGLEDAK